ncbi:MAG: aminoglycoside phosphotransferase family protein [Chloroflexi bacterium]|nr:aminoglycoside phosphotransferase family protein [Chloroflexota bacterium]
MLKKRAIQDQKVIAYLQDEYGLLVTHLSFLPIGADVNTAVYRLATNEKAPYFLKLRNDIFDPMSVILPKFLSDEGITQIIAPIETKTGQLWGNLDSFKTILYPFVAGSDGYDVKLLDHHWQEFGTALKRIHTAKIPPTIINSIHQESYSAKERNIVKAFLANSDEYVFENSVAREMASFLKSKQAVINDIIMRAEQLAQILKAHPPQFVVCHSDLHAGNILISNNGALFIVDWDELIFAAKERDLMYIGGGFLASGFSPQEEEALIYQTYRPKQINPTALAYYRYEQIIQDTSTFCEQLFQTDVSSEDRAESLHYLKSNFFPNQMIEIAYQSDKSGFKSHLLMQNMIEATA